MEEKVAFKNVLGVFAHYGFRKASMEDLARAADVSRQTLYNRLKTKEAVLDWAVDGFVRDIRDRACLELADSDAPFADCLLDAFSRWTGDHAALLHDAPHGAEVIELGTESLRRSDTDPEVGFERAVARFLQQRGVCRTPSEAAEKTYLLRMAGKGLLLKARNSDEFRAGMARIIAAAFPKSASAKQRRRRKPP